MKKVILDTDIGTDVDDCLALAVLLGSPEVELVGVTCVYGDVQLRSRMVRKLLALAGQAETPVYAGLEPPLLGVRPVFWPGHEGVGLLHAEDDALAPEAEHAVDALLRITREQPGEIDLIAIGPLIFLHELGHYLVARWCGVKADVFSIGFGREVFGWTDKRGTRWKLGMLPAQ